MLLKPGKKLDHGGIKVEFVGQVGKDSLIIFCQENYCSVLGFFWLCLPPCQACLTTFSDASVPFNGKQLLTTGPLARLQLPHKVEFYNIVSAYGHHQITVDPVLLFL